MNPFATLIEEVADEKGHSLSQVLLKAKVLAYQLRGRKFKQWLDAEVNGYQPEIKLPAYRVLRTTLRGDFVGMFGARLTNAPISTSHLPKDVHEELGHVPVIDAVAAIEAMIASGSGELLN